jgi:hypothetical protein
MPDALPVFLACHGKKKVSAYSFIKHIGLEWMDWVEDLACDKGSYLEEVFNHLFPTTFS